MFESVNWIEYRSNAVSAPCSFPCDQDNRVSMLLVKYALVKYALKKRRERDWKGEGKQVGIVGFMRGSDIEGAVVLLRHSLIYHSDVR